VVTEGNNVQIDPFLRLHNYIAMNRPYLRNQMSFGLDFFVNRNYIKMLQFESLTAKCSENVPTEVALKKWPK
jgi:hypothetical protein